MSKRNGSGAPIGVFFIVRNRPEALARAVASVRPHVNQVVIVDTGSTDETPAVAKRIADKFAIFTKCNNSETGLIESFGDARNHALSLVTEPWAMWMDSDDELEGGENLATIVRSAPITASPVHHFPYHDQDLVWDRERIVGPCKSFYWEGDCHETLEPKPGVQPNHRYHETLRMVHHKGQDTDRERGRNLRILRATLRKRGYLKPREMFYIGREHAELGHIPEAITWLARATESSPWEDERAFAHMQLSDLFAGRFDFKSSMHHALQAHATCEHWAEPLVKIARVHYFLANRDLDRPVEWREHIRRCAYFCKRALQEVTAKTSLFIDRDIRRIEVHRYLNFALYHLGDFEGALASVDAALAVTTDEGARKQLNANRKLYLEKLGRPTLKLVASGDVKSDTSDPVEDART